MNNFQGFNNRQVQASTPAGTALAVFGLGATPTTSAAAVGTASAVHSGSAQNQPGAHWLSKSQRKRLRKATREFERHESAETSEQTKEGRWHTLSFPSPLTRTPAKKPRSDFPPRSYRQDVSGIKMAVTKTPCNGKMRPEDVSFVNQNIDEAIDHIPPGGQGPQILSSILMGGALIINCSNESTVAWLQQFFSDGRWAAWGYKFLPESQIPKPVKIAFKTRDVCTSDVNKLLRRLQLLNPGLSTDEWRTVTKADVCASYARWIFEIDRESAQFIRAKNMELFAGSHGKGLVKILHDPQAQVMTPQMETEGSLATTGATTSIEVLAVEETPDVSTNHLSMEESEAVFTDVSPKCLLMQQTTRF